MLTDWMDAFHTEVSRMTGISVSELSTHLGGEAFGVVLEIVAGWTTKGWLNKMVQVGAGALATAYALFARDAPSRTRAELLQLGAHELSRGIPKTPEELDELIRSIQDMIRLSRVSPQAALATGLRVPAEVARPFRQTTVRTSPPTRTSPSTATSAPMEAVPKASIS